MRRSGSGARVGAVSQERREGGAGDAVRVRRVGAVATTHTQIAHYLLLPDSLGQQLSGRHALLKMNVGLERRCDP